MKNYLLLILFTFSLTFAQSQVSSSSKAMSKGVYPSLSVNIDFEDQKITEKEWQSFLKEVKGKSKKDRKTKEIVTERASIGGLGVDLIVYGKISGYGNRVGLTVWFESGDLFVTEDDESKYIIAEDLLERFVLHMERVKIQIELDAEEKKLKNYQKDLDQLAKKEAQNYNDIDKYERKIEDARADIVQLEQAQVNKSTEIEDQQKVIEDVRQKLGNVGKGLPKIKKAKKEKIEDQPVIEDNSIEDTDDEK